ncbi:MAG TPA: MATE family efflux transporter [Patescibacteria group bacterium]|nr:MATE family efflux transporter [Patescibacteria group bacterium]
MSIKKEIWKLSFPVMIVILLHTFFGIVDLKFISTLGTIPTAGTVLATSLLEVLLVLSSSISAGTMAIAARSIGAENTEEYEDVSKQSIFFSIFLGLLVYFIAIIFKYQLLGIFNGTEEAFAYAVQYLDIVFLTIPLNFITAVLISILHAKGDTRNPMVALVSANVMNILLDWLFIMVLNWGVRGAAGATLLGIVFSLVYLTMAVLKALNTNLLHLFSKAKLTMGMLFRIIKVGIFSVLYGITRPFTGMLMFQIAARSGDSAVAAFGIGGRWFSLIFIILGGLEAAISILVGQSMGNKNMDKIKHLVKEGLKVALTSVIVLGVPYVFFSRFLMQIFTQDQAVIEFGVRYLRIVFIGLLFVTFTTVFNAVFKGAGDTAPPMAGAFIANWMVKIPLAYLLSYRGMNSDGVWTAIAVSVMAESLVVWILFRRGRWKNKVV